MNKKIKILYLLCADHRDGSSKSLISILKSLKERDDIEPIVVSGSRDKEWQKIIRDLGYKFYLVPMCFHSYHPIVDNIDRIKYPYRMLKRYRRWFLSIRAIKKIAQKEKVDLIHTNVGPIHVGHVVAHRLHIPHVWHVREYGDTDFNIKEYPSTSSFRECLAEDYTISITEDIRRHNLLENNSKAYVIYNGVRKHDDVHYDANKEKYFMCASSISRAKGHDNVIRAFSIFHQRHPDWKLRIFGYIGKQDFFMELKRMIKALGLEDAVSFEGHKTDVSDYMRKAKALLVASHYEGFGRMTAEASFAGTMVIGRNTGGTLEIMEKTGGLLFSNDDEFIAAMEKVASMPDEVYKTEVLHSQNKAQEFFSEEAYCEKVFNVYMDVMKDTNRKAE